MLYMEYERYILLIMREAYPDGMPLRKIVLNVYNITNTLFERQSLSRVHRLVAEWLRAESRRSGGAVCKMDLRGWYKLNECSSQVEQLPLEFTIDENDRWML